MRVKHHTEVPAADVTMEGSAGCRVRWLIGEGDHVAHLLRTLGQARGGIDYQFVGAISPSQDGIPLPRLG